MNKRTLAMLERLFVAEIDGKTTQLPPKTAAKLEDEGLIRAVEHSSNDRLGTFTWTTHELTHAGRWAYCETCTDEEEAAREA